MQTISMMRMMVVMGGLMVAPMLIAQAPAGAPAGSTGMCKDGTYSTAASKAGACRGHQGVKDWYVAAAAGAVAAPAKAGAPAAKAAPAPATMTPAKAAPTAAAAMPAKAAPMAAAGPKPAGAMGECKDGTFSMAASKAGACRGHQGVKEWYAAAPPAAAAKSAPAMATPTAPAMATPTAPAAPMAAKAAPTAAAKGTAAMTQAAGGGPGMVWLNTGTKVYHCSGTQYYGKTKEGKYMSEVDAKAMGAHADHNKPCTK